VGQRGSGAQGLAVVLQGTTELIVDLFLLMGSAVLAGEIAAHLGQPALVGQLLVGIVLGPTLFGSTSLGTYVGLNGLSMQLSSIQILATIFILFMAGLEVAPERIVALGPWTILTGAAIFVVPFAISTAVVLPIFHYGLSTSLFIGLALSITALPVMGIMLSEFGLLRTKLGDLLMGLALINELTAVSTFAILQGTSQGSGSGIVGFVEALLSVAVFIATVLSVHFLLRVLRAARLWEPLKRGFQRTWRSKQGNFALLMVMVVGSTLFSQFLGLTYVVGAFYAGMLVTRESTGEEAHRSISTVFDTMSWGFFVPLFFAFVGVEMNLRYLLSVPIFLGFLALLAVALSTKFVVGAGLSRALGWGKADSTAIGFMVSSRGAVELAMATILLTAVPAIINTSVFTIIAFVGLLATIVAPVGALQAWLSDPTTRGQLYERVPSMRPSRTSSPKLQRPPLSWEEMRALFAPETAWPSPPEGGSSGPLSTGGPSVGPSNVSGRPDLPAPKSRR
jgi:Kef-type K+ transport system membrane component KefB